MGGVLIRTNQTKQRKTNKMKKTMTQYDIAHELLQDEHANWSRAGAFALAEYFEQIEMDTNEELDFDAVSIRCDFSEYESLEEWADDYFGGDAQTVANALGLNVDMSGVEFEEDEEEVSQAIREYILNNGEIIEFDGGIIVSSF
jgi:hypothetical protein